MAKKYIDANKLKAEIERLTNQKKEKLKRFSDEDYTCSVASSINCKLYGNEEVLSLIDSLQQEQPDFPTTDEQVKEFLATHPKIKVPEKYKNPDWLFKKQEQPEVDLENEIITQWSKYNPTDEGMGSEYAIIAVEQFDAIARYFCELGRKQVLQEIYDGKTKPVDKITAAWLDDKEEENK